MPTNRNALIRYQTIDKCLQNRFRKWTLDHLIEAVSDALYEYEGIDKGVSRRTIQADIQVMRSEKLGYNAPIIVMEKKYYSYEDPKYSIANIPLSKKDLSKLKEVTEILRQFKGFDHFKDMSSIIQRLEDKIYTAKTNQVPIIDFEKNEHLRGIEFIEGLYQAILQKYALDITYQSFKAQNPQTFVFHPYLLKEYRNRWFVLGQKSVQPQPFMTLALDRILTIQKTNELYYKPDDLNLQNYFDEVIGVTVSNQASDEVILKINKQNAPYVLTKPIHQSQKVLETVENGIIISIKVQWNFELEREILGFGEAMEVLAPAGLRRKMSSRVKKMNVLYTKSNV
jgi:predicted DNA-binding transcriptional regulator YafY